MCHRITPTPAQQHSDQCMNIQTRMCMCMVCVCAEQSADTRRKGVQVPPAAQSGCACRAGVHAEWVCCDLHLQGAYHASQARCHDKNARVPSRPKRGELEQAPACMLLQETHACVPAHASTCKQQR